MIELLVITTDDHGIVGALKELYIKQWLLAQGRVLDAEAYNRSQRVSELEQEAGIRVERKECGGGRVEICLYAPLSLIGEKR